MDGPYDNANMPDPIAFTVLVDGNLNEVTGVSDLDGTSFRLELNTIIINEDVTVAYDATGQPWVDAAMNPVPSWTAFPVVVPP